MRDRLIIFVSVRCRGLVQIKTELGAETEPSSAARRFSRETLQSWDVPQDLLDQVELVVSELVGNAIKHAGGANTLEIAKTTDGIRVAVSDRGGGTPRTMRPGLLEEGGRGLFIVQAVSSRWGHHPAAEGKTVWAEFTMPAQVSETSESGMLTY